MNVSKIYREEKVRSLKMKYAYKFLKYHCSYNDNLFIKKEQSYTIQFKILNIIMEMFLI